MRYCSNACHGDNLFLVMNNIGQCIRADSMHKKRESNSVKHIQCNRSVIGAVVDRGFKHQACVWNACRYVDHGVKRPPFWRRYFAGRSREWLPEHWRGPTHQRRAQLRWPAEHPQWWGWATHTPRTETQPIKDMHIAHSIQYRLA